MLTSKKIIEICQKYFIGGPTQRVPERVKTLGDIELETKVNIDSLNDVEIVLSHIKSFGFSKVSHRKEWHHFFSDDLVAHGVLILVENSDEIWVKIKKDKKVIYTPCKNFALLSRHEKKLKPQDEGYRDEFQKVVSQNYIGSFQKECLDFSFYYKNLSFTATLSLVDSKESNLYQIEFEFDGHKENDNPPSHTMILNIFEEMLTEICGAYVIRLTTHTKLEWLLSVKNMNQ